MHFFISTAGREIRFGSTRIHVSKTKTKFTDNYANINYTYSLLILAISKYSILYKYSSHYASFIRSFAFHRSFHHS